LGAKYIALVAGLFDWFREEMALTLSLRVLGPMDGPPQAKLRNDGFPIVLSISLP
jgi:hypothetical protein